MRIRILGTAAGGGLPQWNCRCRYCEAARRGLIPARTQASLAFTAGGRWYLVNATPDVTTHLAATPDLHPRSGVRATPFAAVLLTDAELDHTLGLLHLREGAGWAVHAPAGILHLLTRGVDVQRILGPYHGTQLLPAPEGDALVLGRGDDAVHVTWLPTGGDLPLYASAASATDASAAGPADAAVYALVLRHEASGRSVVYAPGVAHLTEALDAACRAATVVYFDGTFWTGDEMPNLSGNPRNAADMGHWPVAGVDGSAAYLATLAASHRRFVHVNNTNPLLDPTSPQRNHLRALGLDVADDGEELEIA